VIEKWHSMVDPACTLGSAPHENHPLYARRD
jgi:hypothetical protein